MKKTILYGIILFALAGIVIGLIPQNSHLPDPRTIKLSTVDTQGAIERDLPKVLRFGDPVLEKLIKEIRNLKPGQVMIINDDSLGGDVIVGAEFINALKETKGTVIAKVNSIAASMAADILPFFADVQAGPYAIILVHEAYIPGPGGEKLRPTEDPVLTWANDMGDEILKPVLTDEQFADYKAGKDVVIKAPDFVDALHKAHVKH